MHQSSGGVIGAKGELDDMGQLTVQRYFVLPWMDPRTPARLEDLDRKPRYREYSQN